MLEHLHIRNYALIDRLSISFTSGLNILSGETGAGKSILVGAISLIIGGRSDSGMIRTGTDETVITALVRIPQGEAGFETLELLSACGIVPEDGSVLIRRILRRNGRSTITISSEPVTLKDLQRIARTLFDLHGQHEHQSILYEASQRRLLDSCGGIAADAAAYAGQHAELRTIRKQLASYAANERALLREKDMLEYAVEEIAQAALRAGEEEELQAELKLLGKAEQLTEDLEEVIALLKGGSQSILVQLRSAVRAMKAAAEIDPRLEGGRQQAENSLYELEDAAEQVRHYRESIDFSPERIDRLHERLQLINALKRKYGDSIPEILAYRRQAEDRLGSLEMEHEGREELEQKAAGLEQELRIRAGKLTRMRTLTAARLSPSIGGHLAQLGMPGAEFTIAVMAAEQLSSMAESQPHGVDSVRFLISPNPGEPLKELKAIASGGELSRVMLALKSEFSENDAIDTLIFDEIDTGIGGTVAVAVGKHLKALSRYRQVLCITHLASLAAQADTHFMVRKQEDQGRTVTMVEQLEGEVRVAEIARMLSGDAGIDTALAHARELLHGDYAAE